MAFSEIYAFVASSNCLLIAPCSQSSALSQHLLEHCHKSMTRCMSMLFLWVNIQTASEYLVGTGIIITSGVATDTCGMLSVPNLLLACPQAPQCLLAKHQHLQRPSVGQGKRDLRRGPLPDSTAGCRICQGSARQRLNLPQGVPIRLPMKRFTCACSPFHSWHFWIHSGCCHQSVKQFPV